MKYKEIFNLAIERGFNKEEYFKHDLYLVPLEVIQKWIRDKHHINISILYCYELTSTSYYSLYNRIVINHDDYNKNLRTSKYDHIRSYNDFKTYEEALESVLYDVLKII